MRLSCFGSVDYCQTRVTGDICDVTGTPAQSVNEVEEHTFPVISRLSNKLRQYSYKLTQFNWLHLWVVFDIGPVQLCAVDFQFTFWCIHMADCHIQCLKVLYRLTVPEPAKLTRRSRKKDLSLHVARCAIGTGQVGNNKERKQSCNSSGTLI